MASQAAVGVTGRAVTVALDEFRGDVDDVEAKTWLKRFERYLLDRGIDNGTDARKIRYFETFMVDAAMDWFEGLDDESKTKYDALKKAFLHQFGGLAQPKETPASRYNSFRDALKTKRTIEDIRDQAVWRVWLSEVLALSNKVDKTYAPEPLKASMFWDSLPTELKTYITKGDTVLDIVTQCRDLSTDVYEEIVEQYDAIRTPVLKMQTELADVKRQMADLRRRQVLPPSPPEEKRARFEGPAPAIRSRPAPKAEDSKIPVQVFPDTPDGHRRYEEALRLYVAQHPRATASPSPLSAYPLTPGTAPPGVGECHRCGLTGHPFTACPSQKPISQAEQVYRRNVANYKKSHGLGN